MRGAMLGLVAAFVGCGCMCGGIFDRGDDPGYKTFDGYMSAESDARQAKLQPVIDALAKHNAERNEHPKTLNALVDAGHLAALPDLSDETDHQGKPNRLKECSLVYKPNAVTYTLTVRFRAWSGITTRYSYSNDTRWITRYDPWEKKWTRGSPQRLREPWEEKE